MSERSHNHANSRATYLARLSQMATTGIAFSPGSSIVFDAAVVTGLSDDAPDFQILFGVTTNLGRLWTPSDD